MLRLQKAFQCLAPPQSSPAGVVFPCRPVEVDTWVETEKQPVAHKWGWVFKVQVITGWWLFVSDQHSAQKKIALLSKRQRMWTNISS